MPPTLAVPQPQWNPLEALAAWALPGLGHLLLGQKKRGLIIGLTILGLWLSGLLVGGIYVVDRRAPMDPLDHNARAGLNLWFLGQAMLGPSLVVEWGRSKLPIAGITDSNPPLAYAPSFGRAHEQGTLFTALAGLLNLLAVLDVVYCDRKARKESR